ncbi:MAG: SDR family NAD(P)-dependent oxidoreductase [bacterium]|nr:SDR family NAD(P)-dependent oxidoreductase [bacterium]
MDKPIAFITGATSGIGEATSKILAPNFNLIICGRRADRLEKLKSELKASTNVETLEFDVRDKAAVDKSIESLSSDWKKIDLLVNNAGNAHGLDPIQSGSVEDWDAMIDINVKGLLYVSKAIIPGMVERESGHIVNIGSIAGKEVYPNGNVYCASKHAVDAINNGMRMDLNSYGIKVTSVNPGLVETEFSQVRFKGDNQRADTVYKGYDALQAEDIADLIRYIVEAPKHVLLSDVIILPTAQANATIIKKDL